MKIGIDLGGTNVRVALVDDNGIINITKEPCKADKSVKETTSHIIELIRRVITAEVTGIGIGVPSAVDPEKGIVYNVINIPSWKEVHLKEIIETAFYLPTYVNNDANCFVLGEQRYGAAKSARNVVGIAAGTGLGSGIIINNELYAGTNTCAGEIGCISYRDKTYEEYCSSRYFIREHNTSGVDAFGAAKKGDEAALKIWDDFGIHMGNLVQMVLFAYDPEVIVFGGSIANAFELFESSMRRNLQEFLFPNIVNKLRIEVSRTADVGILGAASLVKQ